MHFILFRACVIKLYGFVMYGKANALLLLPVTSTGYRQTH
jgi:hypothetical protein